MKTLFHLFFLMLWGKLVFSFTCSDITNQTKCTYLNSDKCSWSGSSCTGTYEPTSCTNCFYVDKYSTSGVSDGSIASPYKTLSEGLIAKNTASVVATFIILNYKEVTEVSFPTIVALTGTFTIKPLFEDGQYKLDFSQITGITAATSFIKASKYLYLKGAVIEYQSTVNSMSLFEGSAATANITFENVDFYSVSHPMLGNVIKSPLTYPSAFNFTYLGGTISDVSSRFYFQSGTTYWRDIRFMGTTKGTGVFHFRGPQHVFENLYVTNIINGATIFAMGTTTQLAIIGALFEDTTLTFWTSTRVRGLTIKDAEFRNIVATKSHLFQLTDVDAADSKSETIFQNVTFENISVQQTIFQLAKNGVKLTLDKVSMKNITKQVTNSASDFQIESQWPGGVCALASGDSNIVVRSSNFTNIGHHCFGLIDTALTVEDSLFDNSDLIATPIPINSTTISKIAVKTGVTWINIEDLTQYNNLSPQVILKRNVFKTNKLVSLYGGAIRYTGAKVGQIYAEDNQFIGLNAVYGGAIYGNNPLLGFNFSGNVFKYNQAYDGGAIYKVSVAGGSRPFLPSVQMTNDQFIGNKAVRNGGGAYLDWESLNIKESVFDENSAHIGGGIYFLHLDIYNNGAYGGITGTKFTNNYAKNVGGAMKLFFSYPELREDPLSPTYFSNNIDREGLEEFSTGRPAYYIFSFYNVLIEKTFSELDDLSQYVTNSSRTSLAFHINTSEPNSMSVSHKSGHELDYIVSIQIYDDTHEPVSYVEDESIVARVTETRNSSSGFAAFAAASPIYLPFERGTLYFKTQVKLYGEPRSQATLNFKGNDLSSNILKALGLIMDYDLEINFRDCEIGDIYDRETRTCNTCPKGTYSLKDPYALDTICTQCDPSQQLCLGGSKIGPQPGYWRYDESLPVVVECPEEDACRGSLFEERYYPHGYCPFPYEGNLCNKCATNYAKFGSDEKCTNCEQDSLYYVKFMGFFILRIAAVVYSVKMNLSKISGTKKSKVKKNGEKKESISDDDFQSNLMKIVVNFLQVSTIIFQYKFDWPDFVLKVMDVTNKVIPTNSEGFSIDCIVALGSQSSENIYFIKLVVTLIEPLGLWLGLIGVYVLYLKYNKEKIQGNPKVKKNAVVLFVITAFIVQPSLIQSTLELFKCTNLRGPDDPTYFMTKDPQVQCWTPKHLIWSLGIAFPFFLLWGVVLPVILLRKLIARAKSLHKAEVYAKYSFVYEGLKTKRYYWEFVTLVRKTLIVIIFVFLNIITVQAQAFATFLVIMCFAVFHIKFWPYSDRRLNRLELFSLVTLGVMAYCGMFFLSGGSTDALTIFLIIVSLIFNLAFYGAVGYYFLKAYRKKASKVTRKIATKVKESIDKSRSRSNRSSDSNSSNSDTSRSKESANVKEFDDIMNDINLDSPTKKDEEKNKDNSESNISDVPNETYDSPVADQRLVYSNNNISGNNSSVVRNFNVKPLSLHGRTNNNFSVSFNNSSLNLLSPGMNSGFSSGRKLLNNTANQDSNLLRPRQRSDLAFEFKANEYSESRNLGISYEDSPRLGISRIQHQASYQDDSLILKIPNTPSELKSNSGTEENANKET